ncbi:MAG: hypothetical protein BM559_08845 [Roseobacter sp. MedPE-SWchi]|mgnify:CR=1 FL=1|nr:MAG: hypothetical protein BM559_08845 [Roseobacter sp. MedPE-SWchi]
MSKRKQHHPEFKEKVALETLQGEATVSELTSWFAVYLHAWKRGSEAKAGGRNWIDFYNHKHLHSALGGEGLIPR